MAYTNSYHNKDIYNHVKTREMCWFNVPTVFSVTRQNEQQWMNTICVSRKSPQRKALLIRWTDGPSRARISRSLLICISQSLLPPLPPPPPPPPTPSISIEKCFISYFLCYLLYYIWITWYYCGICFYITNQVTFIVAKQWPGTYDEIRPVQNIVWKIFAWKTTTIV